MKKIVSLILVIILCTGLFSCMPNLRKYAVKYADDPVEFDSVSLENEGFVAFINKINTFAINMSDSLYKSGVDQVNFCISPASIFISLATACESANGETRDQILSALNITYDELIEYTSLYYSLCNKEFTYTNSYGAINVSAHERLVNSVWMSSDKEYKSTGVNSITKNYYGNVFSASFKDNSAKKVINQYIEYISHNIIPGNVNISPDTELSFISAYHLKEIWNEFGRTLNLSLESYDFINEDQSSVTKQLLKSPYTEGRVTNNTKYTSFHIDTEHKYRIYFMVPSKNYTLDEVFTPKNISQVISITDHKFIDHVASLIHYTKILFPELDVSFSGDISKNLQEDFGIKYLFDAEKCDLSNLFVSDAHCNSFIHTSRLRLDAKGIEGETINLGRSEKTPEELPDYEIVYHDYIVNRDFGFILTDPNGVILYIGRVNSLN